MHYSETSETIKKIISVSTSRKVRNPERYKYKDTLMIRIETIINFKKELKVFENCIIPIIE